MRYIFDLDNTLVSDTNGDYNSVLPNQSRIDKVNELYDSGHFITIWTARGARSGVDWYDFTVRQLSEFGIKYHIFSTGKPNYDIWVDDKAINSNDFFK